MPQLFVIRLSLYNWFNDIIFFADYGASWVLSGYSFRVLVYKELFVWLYPNYLLQFSTIYVPLILYSLVAAFCLSISPSIFFISNPYEFI